MILRIIVGLFTVALGFFMVWKTVLFQDFFGANAWAERKLGPGGTRSFYKLLGVGVAFLGMLIATNVISGIIESTVGIFIRT